MTTFMSTYDRAKFELDLLREIAQAKLATYRTTAGSAMQFGDQSLQHRMQQRYRLWAEELRWIDWMQRMGIAAPGVGLIEQRVLDRVIKQCVADHAHMTEAIVLPYGYVTRRTLFHTTPEDVRVTRVMRGYGRHDCARNPDRCSTYGTDRSKCLAHLDDSDFIVELEYAPGYGATYGVLDGRPTLWMD